MLLVPRGGASDPHALPVPELVRMERVPHDPQMAITSLVQVGAVDQGTLVVFCREADLLTLSRTAHPLGTDTEVGLTHAVGRTPVGRSHVEHPLLGSWPHSCFWLHKAHCVHGSQLCVASHTRSILYSDHSGMKLYVWL